MDIDTFRSSIKRKFAGALSEYYRSKGGVVDEEYVHDVMTKLLCDTLIDTLRGELSGRLAFKFKPMDDAANGGRVAFQFNRDQNAVIDSIWSLICQMKKEKGR